MQVKDHFYSNAIINAFITCSDTSINALISHTKFQQFENESFQIVMANSGRINNAAYSDRFLDIILAHPNVSSISKSTWINTLRKAMGFGNEYYATRLLGLPQFQKIDAAICRKTIQDAQCISPDKLKAKLLARVSVSPFSLQP